jgi:DNA-directed RNA polymerase subunit RPC12/RpoP
MNICQRINHIFALSPSGKAQDLKTENNQMSKARMDNFTLEQLTQLAAESNSFNDLILKLGYNTRSGSNHKTVKSRLDKYGINYSHFSNLEHIKRNEKNVFIENSTATQRVLRHWYKKGQYTEYKCSICGMKPIWQEKALVLILDHINGHNTDDRLENLRWVCPNCNMQLPTTNGRNKKRSSQKYCIDCGKKINLKAIRCNKCEGKRRAENNQILISRRDLKDKIRKEPFVKIAKEFNVSDKAIVKWCIKYNLPFKKKDINSYSDEEWGLI